MIDMDTLINIRECLAHTESAYQNTKPISPDLKHDVVEAAIGSDQIQARLQRDIRTALNLLDVMEDSINRIGVTLPNQEKSLFDLLDTILTKDRVLRPTIKTTPREGIDKIPRKSKLYSPELVSPYPNYW